MADWYASSAAYTAIAAFVPSAVYSVGNIVKPTAPALKSQYAFRCTTAGTASTEPAWPAGNNATVTTGGATFTNVSGQSTYGWSAAAGDLPSILAARFAAGDRIFVSSDHAETQTSTTEYGNTLGSAWTLGQILSVNRAGSVPPVAADLTAGATVTVSGANSIQFSHGTPCYYYGINFIYTGGGLAAFVFGNSGAKTHYFDACQFYMNTATGCRMQAGGSIGVVWNNTTLRFGNAGQYILPNNNMFEIVWQGTASAILGTIPTALFNGPTTYLTARGVDISALNTTLWTPGGGGAVKILLDSCRIASGLVRLGAAGNVGSPREMVELVNCYDGTNIINERYTEMGAVTTDRSTTLVGGAQDDVGLFSLKLVSTAFVDKVSQPLEGFWLDVENTAIGSSHTATVEFISSGTLNNDEISLLLEHQGTAGSPLASFVNTLPNVLATASAVTSSTATWNSMPSTPQRQRLQATFTPQVAGRVRGYVRLGKASTTVWLNPQLVIT